MPRNAFRCKKQVVYGEPSWHVTKLMLFFGLVLLMIEIRLARSLDAKRENGTVVALKKL
jgi:hypothetical protein